MTTIEETLQQKGKKYGDFKEHSRISQNIKQAMKDSPNWHKLSCDKCEALEMLAHKIARILNGECDALPEQALYMVGTLEEAFKKNIEWSDKNPIKTNEYGLQMDIYGNPFHFQIENDILILTSKTTKIIAKRDRTLDRLFY